jgi:type IV pilus assembly protein PilM
MSDSPTTIALNIGSQRISVAVFETSKQGDLVLKGYASETIVVDPAFEASREIQIQVALKDIVEKLDIAKLKVRYALSAQAVFMRFVKLPPIQDDNIEQLVTFEARQHVPFPLSEVVWDYELIEGSKEKEAVIVAIKSDELEEINDIVNSSGLTTAEVDVAPMALYNAYRSAYGVSDEPILIVDIGAKSSSLLYVEGKRFFTRSVQIGGASISTAIAKEYRVPFGEAEHQKIHNGLVVLGGGHTDSLDESMAALAMVIRNALTRLTSDITRTTNYYRSQHNGSAPKKVLLAGGGANLPYTLEFLEEKLGLPVEFFNPLTNIAITKDVDLDILQREAHMMGELVGLGLRGIGKSAINIDLVPAAVEQIRDADRRKPFLIAAAAVLVAGFGAWALLSQLGAAGAADKARTMSEVKDNLSPHATKINSLFKNEKKLNEVAAKYTNLQEDHAYWFNVISEVNEAFANDSVWLTELSPIYGFNPIPPKDAAAPVTAPQQVIPRSFANNASGAASLITIPSVVEEEVTKGKLKNKGKSAPKFEANAIMIRGYWRENSLSQNVVSELLKNLRENSTVFKFTITEANAKPGKKAKDSKAKEIYLSDEQLLKPSAAGGNDDLGFPFELILPLANPVAVK